MRFHATAIAVLAVASSFTLAGCSGGQTAPSAGQRLACGTVWGNTSCWTLLVAIAAAPTRFHDVPVIVDGWMAVHRDWLALFPADSGGQPREAWLSVLLAGVAALWTLRGSPRPLGTTLGIGLTVLGVIGLLVFCLQYDLVL